MEVSSQLKASATLPQGKNPWHPIDRGGWEGPKGSLDTVVNRKNPFSASIRNEPWSSSL